MEERDKMFSMLGDNLLNTNMCINNEKDLTFADYVFWSEYDIMMNEMISSDNTSNIWYDAADRIRGYSHMGDEFILMSHFFVIRGMMESRSEETHDQFNSIMDIIDIERLKYT
jgi:hypothetical protein